MATLQSLAQTTRLEAVTALTRAGDAGMTAGDLSELLGVARSNLFNHLAILERANLVSSKRSGRSVIYAIRRDRLDAFVSAVQRLIAASANN